MTRFDKHLAAFAVATLHDDPDKRFRELNQLSKCVTTLKEWNLYMDLQEKFESENDLTADGARSLLQKLKK